MTVHPRRDVPLGRLYKWISQHQTNDVLDAIQHLPTMKERKKTQIILNSELCILNFPEGW